MANDVTATVVRNDRGVATHYDMKVGDRLLGKTTKTDKGLFKFEAMNGLKIEALEAKTMRDLKTAIGGKVPAETAEEKAAREAATPPKPAATAAKTTAPAKAAETPPAGEAAEEGESADVELD